MGPLRLWRRKGLSDNARLHVHVERTPPHDRTQPYHAQGRQATRRQIHSHRRPDACHRRHRRLGIGHLLASDVVAQGPARLLGLRRLPARRAHAGARRRRQRHRAVLHGEPHPHHEGAVLPVRAVGNGGHRGRALLRTQRRRHQGHPARHRGPAVRRLGRRLHHHPAARAQHGALRRAVRADAVAQGARGLHRS